MFLIKCLKLPNDSFNINNLISFASRNTQLDTSNKLQHNRNPTSVLTTIATLILHQLITTDLKCTAHHQL